MPSKIQQVNLPVCNRQHQLVQTKVSGNWYFNKSYPDNFTYAIFVLHFNPHVELPIRLEKTAVNNLDLNKSFSPNCFFCNLRSFKRFTRGVVIAPQIPTDQQFLIFSRNSISYLSGV